MRVTGVKWTDAITKTSAHDETPVTLGDEIADESIALCFPGTLIADDLPAKETKR